MFPLVGLDSGMWIVPEIGAEILCLVKLHPDDLFGRQQIIGIFIFIDF
jgi:hypothetical protein